MTPLWKVMDSVVTKEPSARCTPVVWHFNDVKSLVMESGGLITAEEAKRRVLILENPGHARRIQGHQHAVRRHPDDPAGRGRAGASPRRRRRSASCSTARAPTPRSRARRPSCRRAISSSPPIGRRTITATPPKKPMLWLDVLDFPAVNFFEASFAEHFDEHDAEDHAAGRRLAGASTARACCPTARRRHNRTPGDQLHLCAHAADPRAHAEGRRDRQAPRRARALRQSDHRRPGAADHGRLPRDAPERVSRASRIARPTARSSSAPRVDGTTKVDGEVLEWGPNDVFVVPPWKRYSHNAGKEIGAVLDLRPPGAGGARHLARGEIESII